MTYYYNGDINLGEGGMFVQIPDDLTQDYAEVTRVSPLEHDGKTAYLIEEGSVYLSGETNKVSSALSIIGCTLDEQNNIVMSNGDILKLGTLDHWKTLTDAYYYYWGIDNSQTQEVITFEEEFPESLHGMEIKKKEPENNITQYVKDEYEYVQPEYP